MVSFVVDDGKVEFEPPGSWTARTYGIFKREGAPVLSDRELKDAAEQAIVDEVIERDERVKRGE
jgi:hypothetical protein